MKRVIKAEFESIHASLDRIDGGGFQSVHDEQKNAEDNIKFTTNGVSELCSLVYSGGLSRDLSEFIVEIKDPNKSFQKEIKIVIFLRFILGAFSPVNRKRRTQRSSKLLPRGDGPFQVVEKVNENAYKLDLPGEYNLLLLFRKSFHKNLDVSTSSSAHVADPEVLPQGPVTRSKAKQSREVLSLTCAKLLDSFDNVCALDSKLYNVLHVDM
ncbi:hypothetical protein GQ457_01G020670 [Hibiscus cannabinus]